MAGGAGFSPAHVQAVAVQDQYTEARDYHAYRLLAETTVAVQAAEDAYAFTVASPTNFVVGNYVSILHPIVLEGRRSYTIQQAVILSVVGSLITINMPLEQVTTVGTVIRTGSTNMSVDGSVTPVTFRIAPPAVVKWDCTQIHICINTGVSTGVDATTFGRIEKLTKGFFIRKKDRRKTILMWARCNGELKEHTGYKLDYDAVGPSAEITVSGDKVFGGQDNQGVVVRVEGGEDVNGNGTSVSGDELQFVVQDNLSANDEMHCTIKVHVVEKWK